MVIGVRTSALSGFYFMHEHKFIQSNRNGYEICADCGTYHSVAAEHPIKLYQENVYWTYDENRSKPEEQILNLTCTDECGISKVDRVLQFVPKDGQRVLEIGAFPGILLKKLMEIGYIDAIGIEPSERWVEFIATTAPGATIVQGFYPDVLAHSNNDLFHCIVAMDVFEHVDDYDSFIRTTHRLLVKGGVAIFMSPILLEDGFIRERDFKPDEHVWIFSKRFLEPYLKNIFSSVQFARWIVSHELIIMTK